MHSTKLEQMQTVFNIYHIVFHRSNDELMMHIDVK